MTIQEALDTADRMKPNMMDTGLKIKFLNEIEGKVYEEIVMTHLHTPAEAVRPEYDTGTDPATQLIMPAPYDQFYVYWIMMKIDLLNQEADKYNNDAALFDQEYRSMQDWWNRKRMPLPRIRELRI